MIFNRSGGFYSTLLHDRPYLIASTYDVSLKDDKRLIDAMKSIHYVGEVFVDMVLRNGNASNRFVSVFFDGECFNTRKAKILEIDENLLEIEREFFPSHADLVENSALSNGEKTLLLYGRCL